MSWYQNFKKRQAGNPTLLAVAAIGFTMSFYGFYRLIYNPWASRKRMAQSEEYANYLISKGYGRS